MIKDRPERAAFIYLNNNRHHMKIRQSSGQFLTSTGPGWQELTKGGKFAQDNFAAE
jgi:hypothetical protein